MTTKTDNQNEVGTHVFERSGCGRAPFRFVGCFEDRGPKNLGNGFMVGSPGQPMGVCAHCGTGIAICCTIRDADGKHFVVGSTCVEKTGDDGLIRSFKRSPDKRRMDRLRREMLDARKTDEIDSILEDHADLFKSLPHPRGFTDRSTGLPMTFMDFCEWMRANCGASGRHRFLKQLKTTLKENNS
jgi:hypothetical protein